MSETGLSRNTLPRREITTRPQGGSIDIEHVLSGVPQKNKDLYGHVGFAKWGGGASYQPCLIMNPNHFRADDPLLLDYLKRFEKLKANNSTEELGKKMLHLVFFYWDASSRQMFGFISQRDFMAYDDGLEAGVTLVPRTIQAKLDAGKTLTESENAKLRARAMVEEDLSKEPHQRRRGFLDDDDLHDNDTNALETVVASDIMKDAQEGLEFGDDGNDNAKTTEVGRVDDINGGGDGGDAPTIAGVRGQDNSTNLHVDNDSLDDQVDEDCSCALDNQSEEQPMFGYQRQLLSPPSTLAEPRVLYTEQEHRDDDANASEGDQDGQGAADKEDDTTKEAAVLVGRVTVETADKEILVVEKQGNYNDNDNENNDSKEEETADNDEGEKKDDVTSDAGQHANKQNFTSIEAKTTSASTSRDDTDICEGDREMVAVNVKTKKRRVSAEVSQAEISLQALAETLNNVKVAAIEEKKALVQQHDEETAAVKKQNETLFREKSTLEQQNEILSEAKRALEQQNEILSKEKSALKQQNEILSIEKITLEQQKEEEKEKLVKLHNDEMEQKLKEQADAWRKERVALEEQYRNKVEQMLAQVETMGQSKLAAVFMDARAKLHNMENGKENETA